MKFKEPLLASDFVEDKLVFPGLVSPKLDGIRAVNVDGVLKTRSMKDHPNHYIQKAFGDMRYFDGELIFGDPTSPTCYSDTYSAVMTRKAPDLTTSNKVTFHVFDHIERQYLPFGDRYVDLIHELGGYDNPRLHLVEQTLITNLDDLLEYEEKQLDLGYEGVMWRDPDGIYKQGRSSVKEGILLKVKRFTDAEAVVIGFGEQMENTNDLLVDERGYAKRSNHAAGMKGKNTLGYFVVRGINGRFKDVEFNVGIGKGLDAIMRAEVWANREKYLDMIMKYEFFNVGAKDKPRFPKWKGWRAKEDM